MTKLLYQGHGSYRIVSNDDKVIFVDPFAGDGYNLSADIILVTHQHHDHNKVHLITQKPNCKIITNVEALTGNKHNTFLVDHIRIESVIAKNLVHNCKKCVGYLIMVDGIKIYAAGDTSKTDQMSSFAAKQLDYALLPCDGFFNMGLKQSAMCAEIINAKHNIPVHMKPGKLFDRKRAEKWMAPNRLILAPGEEINL